MDSDPTDVRDIQEALNYAIQRRDGYFENYLHHKEQMQRANEVYIQWAGTARILQEKLNEAKK